jgi:hypothetical protein
LSRLPLDHLALMFALEHVGSDRPVDEQGQNEGQRRTDDDYE